MEKGREPDVKTGIHNGMPAFFINGKVQPHTSFKITETPDTEAMLRSAEVEIPAMAKQGIMNCWIPVFIDWTGPGEYDFTDLDRRIETVLRLYDDNTADKRDKAFIAVRIQAAVFSPPWYIDKFLDSEGKPTNLIEFRNPWGKAEPDCINHKNRFSTIRGDYYSTYAISPGDKFWDTYALDCLNAIVRHVRGKWYSNRVFAWLPCAFNTNEWFIRTDAPDATCDFSTPTQRAFHRYLREKGIHCRKNPVPLPAECYKGENVFLNPKKDEELIVEEFSLWLNKRISEIILSFARLIKKHYSDSPKLVGFFYGYTNELSGSRNLSQSGHLGLKHLLESPEIDFFCSPNQYKYRADEGKFTYNQVLGAFANSSGICGKLVFAEDDHRPTFAKSSSPMLATRDEWHDEMFFRRNFAQVLTHGQHMWWYSLSPEWFREKKRQDIIGSLSKIGIEAMGMDCSPVSEVAVVVDESSISAMHLDPELQGEIILESYSAFFPTGTPFEYYELNSFLKHADHSRFKVIVFLNLFLVDEKMVTAVKKLRSDNRTIIFQFAPGFLYKNRDGRAFSCTSASRLTGIELKEEKEPQPLIVWIDPERTPLVPDNEDIRYGVSGFKQVTPILGVVDKKAETLGYLYSGNPGFARKRYTDWTSVFTAAPHLPSRVLSILFQDAGVHLYSKSGDVIYASRSLLAFVSSSRGIKRLMMPGDDTLTDVFTGRKIKLNKGGYADFFMKRHEVRLLWRNYRGKK